MVNIGSFLLFISILFLIFKNRNIGNLCKNFFVLTALMELLIERGYFIQIGSQQIAYRTVCEALMTVICLIYMCEEITRVETTLLRNAFLCVTALFIGWILLITFPTAALGATLEISWDQILVYRLDKQPIIFNTSMLIEIFQILMFLIITFVLYSKFSINDWRDILASFLKYSKIFVILNAIEMITKGMLNSYIYSNAIDYVLGKAIASMTSLTARAGRYTLYGMTKESSHYIFVNLILIIMYIAEIMFYRQHGIKDRTRKKTVVLIYILVLESLLSMSFSLLYYGACLIILLIAIYIEKKGKSSAKGILMLSVILVVGVFLGPHISDILSNLSTSTANFWQRRLASVVEEMKLLINGKWLTANTALEWSNRVRLGSTYETFKLIVYRPLFGLGLSATTAHSSLAMLISGAGVIGSLAYLNFISWSRKIKLCDYNSSLYFSCILIYLITNILSSLGLRPFYECWVIVLFFSFQILSEKPNNRKIQEVF